MGKMVSIEQIENGHHLFDQAREARETLIEQLSNYDDNLAELYLEGMDPVDIPMSDIDLAIKNTIMMSP